MRLSIMSPAAALLIMVGQNQASAQVVVQPVIGNPGVTYYDSYYGYSAFPAYSVPVYRYSVPPVVAYPSNYGYGFNVGFGSYYPPYYPTYQYGWGGSYQRWGGGYGWRR